MRKGIRLCLGFLVLFALPALSLSISLDVSALRHNYDAMPLQYPLMPTSGTVSDGHFVLDWSDPSDYTFNQGFGSNLNPFSIEFDGDSYSSDSFPVTGLKFSQSYFIPEFDSLSNKCIYSGDSIRNMFYLNDTGSFARLGNVGLTYFPNDWSNLSSHQQCFTRSELGSHFDFSTLPPNDLTHVLNCNWSNGAVCNGAWSSRNYLENNVLPYSYSSDSFAFQSHFTDPSTGYRYSNALSFYDGFYGNFSRFSSLSIPLHDFDGYFWDSSNLYSGRDIRFEGAFEFDDGFSWNPDLSNLYFKVVLDGVTSDIPSEGSDLVSYHQEINCTANLISLGGDGVVNSLTRLEYSCPSNLQSDLLYVFPRLVISNVSTSGDGDYVWSSNGNWRFAWTYLVTDNDSTPGPSFNSHTTGGGVQIGNAANQVTSDDNIWIVDPNNLSNLFDNFFPNLIGMFNFNLFNPFSSLFAMFSSGDSCVNIPILGSMLHVDNDQVCPYFPVTVRNILTPVMSIIATMLLFGFLIRWIRSSSSDFSPDASGGNL